MELKDMIKNRMKQLDINNEELSKKVGVSPSTVSRYTRGEITNIRRDKIRKLADALSMEVSSLIDGEAKEVTEETTVNPELLEFCRRIHDDRIMRLIFENTKDLDSESLERILVIIQGIRAEKGFDI